MLVGDIIFPHMGAGARLSIPRLRFARRVILSLAVKPLEALMLHTLFRIDSANPETQRRGSTIILIGIVLCALLILAIPVVVTRPDPLPSVAAMVAGLALIIFAAMLARRGNVAGSGWSLVLLAVLAVGLPSLLRREITSSLFFLVLPIVISSLVLRSWQVWLVIAAALAVVGFDALTTSAELLAGRPAIDLLSNSALVLMTVGTISFIGARIVEQAFARLAQAQAQAESAAQALVSANNGLEAAVGERTAALRDALAAVEARAAERELLIEEISSQRQTIREMSVPVLPVNAHTLVMPIVGALDSGRIHELHSQALNAVERGRARTLLLDITGVPVVDTQVAKGLIQVIQATRLLGAEPILIGVRPEVAQTLVSLGIDLANVRTAASLESALQRVA
jgi:rsbT co-antagonist protein RsbR